MTNVASIGFFNHSKMALTSDPDKMINNQGYTKNLLEKVGSFLSWHVVELPAKVYHALRDPRVVTVACTALAMLSVQFAFYPRITAMAAKAIVSYVAHRVPAWLVKASVYTFIQTAIAGLGTRALGRFSNSELMQKWYTKA